MTFRSLIVAGALGLLLSGVQTAQAQSLAPDPTLTQVFNTDQRSPTGNPDNLGAAPYINSLGLGVGFDASSPLTSNSPTTATAQSVFNTLVFNSATSSDVVAGSNFQIGVHASGQQASTSPVTIFASIYSLSGSTGGSTVPLGSAIIRNVPIVIAANAAGDQIYFSNTVTLSNTLAAGQQYVIGFSPTGPGQTAPVDFATVEQILYTRTGQPAGQAAQFENIYLVDNNSGDTGGTYNTHTTANTSVLAYRFYSAGPAAVSEASSVVSLLTMTGLFGAGIARRRRNARA